MTIDVDSGPAELVMSLLETAAIGVVGSSVTTDWRLATGQMTDTPDQQVCCYDSPGQPPNPKWLLDYPCVQVIVRGPKNGYQLAQRKMKNAYDVLLGADPHPMASGSIDAITVLGTPSFIGNDKNERPTFSANFRLLYRPNRSVLTNREPL